MTENNVRKGEKGGENINVCYTLISLTFAFYDRC